MNTRNLLRRRAPFTPRSGEVVVTSRIAREPGRAALWTLFVWAGLLFVSVFLNGCYDEEQRAIYQCADEHVRCIAVVDRLCETDERYCDTGKPFSNRSEATTACAGAYEACIEVATGTRTPDRLALANGGVR